MQTLTEKRVFGAKSATTDVYVACEMGLVVVTVSADQIGEFGLVHREAVSAVTVDGDRVVIGTDDGVRVSERRTDVDAVADRPFRSIPHDSVGCVVAAGTGPTGPLVAGAEGGVFRVESDALVHVGDADDVRAIDGGLLAAADGVFRVGDDGLTHVGLDDVRDVVGHGVPLAATAAGLFLLGNGWLSIRSAPFDRVAGDGHGHAVAVSDDGLLRHAGDDSVSADTSWVDESLPLAESVVDVAYGGGILAAITDQGTLCVDAGDGWRTQPLGVRGVRALAVGSGRTGERGNRNRV